MLIGQHHHSSGLKLISTPLEKKGVHCAHRWLDGMKRIEGVGKDS